MSNSSFPIEWLPQYTYTDYQKWEGDWELIKGVPFAMSPSPTRLHQLTGRKFMRLMEDALLPQDADCNCNVYYELDWIINEHTIVRPDVMIVCGAFEDDFLRHPPVLVLEIFSPATRLKDRNIKFKMYEQSGVKYYLMADPERNTLEIFRLKDNRFEEMHEASFQLTNTCSVDLDFQNLWK